MCEEFSCRHVVFETLLDKAMVNPLVLKDPFVRFSASLFPLPLFLQNSDHSIAFNLNITIFFLCRTLTFRSYFRKTPSKFPVKLTEPVTAVLYITADKLHMEELKHAIHVREIAEGKLVFMWLSCERAVKVFYAKIIYWRINAATHDCTDENRERFLLYRDTRRHQTGVFKQSEDNDLSVFKIRSFGLFHIGLK